MPFRGPRIVAFVVLEADVEVSRPHSVDRRKVDERVADAHCSETSAVGMTYPHKFVRKQQL